MRGRLLLAISVALLLRVAPAEAGFLSAELTVNGLSCPFCVFGIEKKLLDVHGVRDVEVFLDEGRIALTFQPDSEATVDELEEAVEKAGFELAAVSLEVSGELLEEGSVQLVAHPAMTFRLLETRGGGTRPVSVETVRRLREREALGDGSVVVEGAVGKRGEAQPTLVLDGIESAERPKK